MVLFFFLHPSQTQPLSYYRYTSQGDVVVTTSGDKDKVIEIALSLSRKVEVFPAGIDRVDALQARVRDAFSSAYAGGLFEVTTMGDWLVCGRGRVFRGFQTMNTHVCVQSQISQQEARRM